MALFLKLPVQNISSMYPEKNCILLLFRGSPLSDTEMEIPKSMEQLLGGMLCNTPKYTLVVFDMFRVFCKPNLTVS